MAEKCEINDRLMRFFEHCAKFRKYVEDNDTAMHEVDAFKESPEMKKIVEKIANTLCLPLNELNAGNMLSLEATNSAHVSQFPIYYEEQII